MKHIATAFLTVLLALFSINAQGQTSNGAFLEYLPTKKGVSLRAGYELGFNQKELNKKLFNNRRLFIRSSLGLLEMDKQHNHVALNSLVGFRFYNQKTNISFEPLNLGLGYSHTSFQSFAFENQNGNFEKVNISDRNQFISIHLQGFAMGYSIPIKHQFLKVRIAPEAVAYFSTEKTTGSDFGGAKRTPLFNFYFPISLNLIF
ncbi:hypothetical protein [Algoriphagus sp.]|uniref:hypothetical protein n=1 Tax=Algoriphagus sp. TaxID=1872435 RepID=UPI00391A50ED